MHLLEVPAVLAAARIDRDDRDAEQVVAFPQVTVQHGPRIARREIDEPELGVDGRRLPHGSAAVLPDVAVLRPSLVADLAGTGHGVEGPFELAGLRVERLDAAARAEIAAREARDDFAVVVERRAGDAEADLRILGLDRPDDSARALIERDELRVELADEDLAVAEPKPARRPAAAGTRDVRIDVRLVFPEHVAGVDVDRERIVVAGDDVHDAFVDDRLRLIRAARPHAGAAERCAPHAAQVRDVVAVDLGQRRVALIGEVAAVREPTRARQRCELAVSECRRPCHGAPV